MSVGGSLRVSVAIADKPSVQAGGLSFVCDLGLHMICSVWLNKLRS